MFLGFSFILSIAYRPIENTPITSTGNIGLFKYTETGVSGWHDFFGRPELIYDNELEWQK